MFSTTLTVLDGYTRTLVGASRLLLRPAAPADARHTRGLHVLLVVPGRGRSSRSSCGSMQALVDVVTVLAFLTAPLVACAELPRGPGAACAGRVPPRTRPDGPQLGRHRCF